jgi:predicted ATP-dependent endonuclease of OLD family
MRLKSLELRGFRRFESATKIAFDSKLVAVVGPNEAGKSSLLAALLHLNSQVPFRSHGPDQEISRGRVATDDSVVLIATYLIDDGDLPTPKASYPARWFIVRKLTSGVTDATVSPEPLRDREIVTRLQNSLERLMEISPGLLEGSLSADTLQQLSKEMSSLSDETYPRFSARLRVLRETCAGLANAHPLFATCHLDISELIEAYEQAHPRASYRAALEKRQPEYVLFDAAAMTIKSAYGLAKLQAAVPQPLSDLAALAELDLAALLAAVDSGDRGTVEHLLQRSNEVLYREIRTAWKQSALTVRLSTDKEVLYVLVGNAEAGYTNVAERSEGLRRFLSLWVFARSHKASRPRILLVDEAEIHLHYDAQADLVQMLERQDLFSQVIYTTHSVGCLPEDLGTGVRLVSPTGDQTSCVQNAFWNSAVAGFSPLLFGMGASTLAFVPLRFSVLVEGASDFILLPTLLRHATGRDVLGYQMAPGLSQLNPAGIGVVDNESPRTAYLVDGDRGGAAIRRKLLRAGIDQARIVTLAADDMTLEDLICPTALAEAINEELRRSHTRDAYVQAADLAVPMWRSVLAWCDSRQIPAPSKVAVAYRLLELAHGGASLINGEGVAMLRKLDEYLRAALKTNHVPVEG